MFVSGIEYIYGCSVHMLLFRYGIDNWNRYNVIDPKSDPKRLAKGKDNGLHRHDCQFCSAHRLVWHKSPTLAWQSLPHLLQVKVVG